MIDSDRIDRTTSEPPPEAAPIEDLRGRTNVEDATPPVDGASPTADLRAVTISGSSLAPALLEHAWRAEVGGLLDAARLARISDALTALYRDSDIALFTIVAPKQDLSDGVLDIHVVEGRVSAVLVQTDAADAKDVGLIKAYAAQLVSEAPLSRAAFERQLSLMRDIPGERIEASFAPVSGNQVKLVITARRNRADFGVALSHRPTPLLGDTQVNADLSLNGWLRGGDKLALALSTSAQDDLFQYGALSYATPIGDHGLRASLGLSSMSTQPALAPTEGRANTASATLSYPFVRTFKKSTVASLGFDAMDSENSVFGQLVDSSRTRVVRASLSRTQQNKDRALSVSLSASKGLDALGARVNPLSGEADFIKLSGQLFWTRSIGDDATIRVRSQAQVSESDLPASERLALGGEQYGRAFPSALIQGDAGFAASIELANRPAVPIRALKSTAEFYAFADGGSTWLHGRGAAPSVTRSLSSAGAGTRLQVGKRVSIGVEVARPLSAPEGYDKDDWLFTYYLRARDPRQ